MIPKPITINGKEYINSKLASLHLECTIKHVQLLCRNKILICKKIVSELTGQEHWLIERESVFTYKEKEHKVGCKRGSTKKRKPKRLGKKLHA